MKQQVSEILIDISATHDLPLRAGGYVLAFGGVEGYSMPFPNFIVQIDLAKEQSGAFIVDFKNGKVKGARYYNEGQKSFRLQLFNIRKMWVVYKGGNKRVEVYPEDFFAGK